MNTVLGIDLGTQSLKVVFYDFELRKMVASASSPLEVLRDDAGRAEQQAQWWIDALQSALNQIPADVRSTARAVGVSGQQHGFVPMDDAGNVLANVKLWCDTSTQTEVDEITSACGGRDACIATTGNPVLAGYTSPKIRWLAKHHPESYAKMTRIALPHDYLNYLLSGEWFMEFGDASGTGLLDVRTRTWSDAMARAVDPDRDLLSCLPHLVEPYATPGRVSAEAASQFGIPAGIPLAPGGGDNMMAAIGTGNVAPGHITMSLGTSGTVFAYADTPVVDAAGNIAGFCSSTGGWLPLLCTMNCTFATETIRTPLKVETSQFDSVAGSVSAGADGLTVLPFFNGERTPDLPHAKATVIGLNAQNCTRAHLLRATAEGTTFGIRFGMDELARLGVDAERIVVTGGGSRSTVWRQMIADICNSPVTPLAQDEGASFGAALHALWVLEGGEIHQITQDHVVTNEALACLPDTASHHVYADAYARYRRAVDHMSDFYTA